MSFANAIIKIAEEKGINTDGVSIEEYYVTIIQEAYTELETLFNEKGWTFEDIEKILYPTGLIMSFINEIDEEYVREILEEEGITKEDIDVVLANAKKLSNYFITLDMGEWGEETDMDDLDLTAQDDNGDIEDFDYPVDEDNEPPEDVPPPL
jgi:hypothetical protein